MIVSINQPGYLPWLGYFDRIAQSDLHVVLDNVQFEKNSFANRNRVRTPHGACWLTVPVRTKGRFRALRLDEVEVADQSFAPRHVKTLEANYRRATHGSEMLGWVASILDAPGDLLAPLCERLTSRMLAALGIDTPIVAASALETVGAKSELVLSICRAVNAGCYLSGPFGRQYLDLASFEREGIDVVFHDFIPPVYPQVFPGFEPNLSAVDALANLGPGARGLLSTRRLRNEP